MGGGRAYDGVLEAARQLLLLLLPLLELCLQAASGLRSALLLSAFHCTSEGHRAVCSLLMGRGADPEAANMNGVCPWQCTLMRRDVQLRRIFRPTESDKDCTSKAVNATELHRAIWARDEKLALNSLDRCAGRLENGITPLMVAARTGMLPRAAALEKCCSDRAAVAP